MMKKPPRDGQTGAWRHYRAAELAAQRRMVAALKKAARASTHARHGERQSNHCAYHVGHALVPRSHKMNLYAGTSPTHTSRKRTVLRCPVPGCFYVASLPGEQLNESEAA